MQEQPQDHVIAPSGDVVHDASTGLQDGGAAFPGRWEEDVGDGFLGGSSPGMTLRDYFAAKALAALLTRIDTVSGDYVTNATPAQGAEAAYRYADAMLKARTTA